MIESGIQEVRQRMLTGRLKVFSSLEKYLEEFRRYRRDDARTTRHAGYRVSQRKRKRIEGTAAPPLVVLRHVRRDFHIPALGHELRRVVSLVGAFSSPSGALIATRR